MEAFSLAASIMQVIDFGTNFVITAVAMYRSSSSTPEDLLALRSLQANSESLGAVLGTLKADSSRLAHGSTGNDNDGIIALAKECSKALQKMLDTLDIVKPSKNGNLWRAMKSAVALKWNESSLSALQSQLNDFKHQISLNLLVSVRQYSQKSITQQDEILRRLDKLTADTGASVREPIPSIDQSGFGSSIIQILTRRLGQDDGEAERVWLRTAIISAMLSGDDDIEPSPRILLADDHRKNLEAMFLATLHYESMTDRELAISDAHEATFHWIFNNSEQETAKWSSFTDWLESNEQVYWITGKAGSGKSTLMKFLTQPHRSRAAESSRNLPIETRCTEYLQRWAGDEPFTMASFYFWAAGTTAQKSHKGLLKTLLSQLLRAFPEAIPFASPKQWGVLSLFNEVAKEVPERELHSMFRRAMRHISSKAKVALFVDGLDEFEGDLGPLISTMRDVISCSSSVKLCTASRPWNEFQEAFKGVPSLRLQDLTRSDIQKYVEARFNENQKYMALRDRETGLIDHLISSVVSKASGVFLWVKIVVSSLLAGLSQADRPSDLKRRLDDLPEDLEGLYERIIDNIDPFYLEHAAEYFTLMKTCPRPPPALLFSFTDEEDLLDLPDRLLSGNLNRGATDNEFDRLQDIVTRLNSRCKGLLEVVDPFRVLDSRGPSLIYLGPKIQYLHRTVRDFIGNPNTTRRLGRYLPNSYDPHLTLFYASVVCDARHNSYLPPDIDIRDVMYHATRVSTNSTQELVRGLDRYHEILLTRYGHEENIGLGSLNGVYNAMSPKQQFLCLAIEYGVVGYIKAKVDEGGSLLLSRERLLEASFRESSSTSFRRPLWNFVNRGFKIPTTVSYSLLHIPFLHFSPLAAARQAEVVKALLKIGADPNQEFKFRFRGVGAITTPWRLFIGEIICAFLSTSRSARKARLADLGKITRLMIDFGANVNPSNVEAAIKLLAEQPDRDYVLSRPAWSVHEAIYSALRRMKKDRASRSLEFDKEHQRYLGGGPLKLNQNPPIERLPYRKGHDKRFIYVRH